MIHVNQSLQKHQIGAALIEFAVVLPLLMLLVLGISEFAYVFYHLNILNKSVQNAARFFSAPQQARNGIINGAIDVSSNNPAVVTAKNLAIYGNIAMPSPCTNPTCPLMPNVANYTVNVTSPDSNHIKVTAIYKHDFMLRNALSNFTGGGVPNFYNLTASAVLRVE